MIRFATRDLKSNKNAGRVLNGAFAAVARKSPPTGNGEDYLMAHSGVIYLMGPEGNYVTHFAHGTLPQEMADVIQTYL